MEVLRVASMARSCSVVASSPGIRKLVVVYCRVKYSGAVGSELIVRKWH